MSANEKKHADRLAAALRKLGGVALLAASRMKTRKSRDENVFNTKTGTVTLLSELVMREVRKADRVLKQHKRRRGGGR